MNKIIKIIVKPNSTKGPLIEPQVDESLVIYIREIAADGQANKAIIKLLSDYYNIPKSHIKIIRGKTSQNKVIEIEK